MKANALRHLALESIGSKLTITICAIIGGAFFLIVIFYVGQQERNILRQNERAIHQMLDSVNEGLQIVMITGSADIAELYAKHLAGVRDVESFRVLRSNGLEAFRDNATILEVNEYRDDTDFVPRAKETQHRVFTEDDPNLKQVLLSKQFTYFYNTRMVDGEAAERLTFLLPIKSVKRCIRCHGREREILGVLEFTSSLESVRQTVRETWMQTFAVLFVALIAVFAVAAAVLWGYIVRPIERVSKAMAAVARGNLSQQVPVLGRDELSMMATSFNRMTRELEASYAGFDLEHNKLSTIIMGTDEGIVVTDDKGIVVLVNASAERLLNKASRQIHDEGMLLLLDEPERMKQMFDRSDEGSIDPEMFLRQGRFLAVYASSIFRADGSILGHVAVIRDVTKEKQLEAKLRDLSSTDPLTGLANRRSLDELLSTELALALEQGRDLSVLMFDIDHFKKFNDSYGHDQGDRVLKAFAATTRECVRDGLDSVCRYGGEEFLVIARETPLDGAMILAERIRVAVENMIVNDLRVTTSIGVASLRECGAKTPSELVERADAALYQAKHAGRNRTVADRTAP